MGQIADAGIALDKGNGDGKIRDEQGFLPLEQPRLLMGKIHCRIANAHRRILPQLGVGQRLHQRCQRMLRADDKIPFQLAETFGDHPFAARHVMRRANHQIGPFTVKRVPAAVVDLNVQRQPRRGKRPLKGTDKIHQHRHRHDVIHRDDKFLLDAFMDKGRIAFQGIEIAQKGFAVADKIVPGRRQFNVIAFADKQRHAEAFLELFHGIADGRRDFVQLIGGGGNALVFRDQMDDTNTFIRNQHTKALLP